MLAAKLSFTFSFIPYTVLILIPFSCMNPHFYRPKPVEPVMLTHRHQAKANIIGDQDNFATLNMAYSPIDHLGFAVGAAFLSETKDKGERYFNPYVSAGYYNKISINT